MADTGALQIAIIIIIKRCNWLGYFSKINAFEHLNNYNHVIIKLIMNT